MKITILGTGSFFVSKDRSGSAYLLEANGKRFLIDCGPGTMNRLSQMNLTPEDIDYVLLTHFHPDHTSDLFAFQMDFRLKDFFGGTDIKIPIIYGPDGIDTFTKRLSEVYQLPAFEGYEKIQYITLQPEFEIGGVTVKAYSVAHNAFRNDADAYSLRFEFGGKVVTFSGDSTRSDGTQNACRGADVFICDASYAKGKGSPAHMGTDDIGEIAQAGGCKKVILTHFFPATEKIDLVSEVKEKYSGEVIRGEDFMEVEV